MPQLLACPKCRMVVNVLEGFVGPRHCGSCGAAMTPAPDDEIPVLAEAADPPLLRPVELPDDAPPPRPTIVVPHGPDPSFKPRPVAQAWATVARGLNLQRIGVAAALLLVVAGLLLRWLGWGDAESVGFVVMQLAVFVGGVLFVVGRFCCYRVPPQTGARRWMAASCAGAAVATILTLTASVGSETSGDRLEKLLIAGMWLSLGLWVGSEWAFLWGIGRIGVFVKRRRLDLYGRATAAAVAGLPGIWLIRATFFRGPLLPGMETTLAVLAAMSAVYLGLLTAARRAVGTRVVV